MMFDDDDDNDDDADDDDADGVDSSHDIYVCIGRDA